ncbi:MULTISPECIES: hypothetical protein [Paenarthrobacter]|jgi:hypothetical protein|uniref:hypothetical protein n=1 Tax=Paenarthrobacter TaxID=1742992 RepID=UPI000583BCAE|nr:MULTISPECIES: hypothetical protein [Paenarthrobacter]KIA71763.1 hypothetical protein ANMWB30_35700 [Arthrobacter sp. MWB30]KQR05867.1 hypothetical protein ASF74_00250 [Arthrobacter sp. Leaf145]SKB41807.1 hypothetical protein SAMN05660916_00818 [Arthrobacter sp. 31Cvi3.1E]BCW11975.1 hypothetical protein NtRootA2_32570 [Arthrobacter sp. NtRootA2]BCW16059.1 hypothetical protein NtRootA4_30380 [Arthrobacter sp. NtRootA4]BCW24392.1 hypothetical protein NtRootC7_32590 [Arthrobacter sp. NtRootC7]
MLTFSTARRLAGLVSIAAAALLGVSACQAPVNIQDADVPAWKEKVLPATSTAVLEDSGKILNRDPLVKESADVPAGNYTLTMACDGGGKAYFAVSSGGKKITDAAAACNASLDVVKIKVPGNGPVSISTSSVDAPLIFAYHLVPSGS